MASKVIFWDFDGTLAYREGMWTGTLIEVLKDQEPDLQVSREEVASHLQHGFPWHTPEKSHNDVSEASEWWAMLLPVFERAFCSQHLSVERASELASFVPAQYSRPENWKLFDDTVPALVGLADQGWTHVILSNHVPELPTIVDTMGIANLFEEIYTSAKTGFEKPHPEAYKTALRSFPAISHAWMVGDNQTADVHGAERAGIPAILVRKRSCGVLRQCVDLNEVAKFIRKTQQTE